MDAVGAEPGYAVYIFGSGQDIAGHRADWYGAEKRQIEPLLLAQGTQALR